MRVTAAPLSLDYQLKVVGFTANDAAQCNQCVEFIGLGHHLQRTCHFKCAWHFDMPDVFLINAQRRKLLSTGISQRVGNAFIEACLHNANGEVSAIKPVGQSFFCAKHGLPFIVLRTELAALPLRSVPQVVYFVM
jgi:hypothetical protein